MISLLDTIISGFRLLARLYRTKIVQETRIRYKVETERHNQFYTDSLYQRVTSNYLATSTKLTLKSKFYKHTTNTIKVNILRKPTL